MATYTVTTSKHATLTASTVDTVTISGAARGDVEVAHRGTSQPIYFTTNNTNPTIGGDNTFIALPGAALKVGASTQTVVVKLISAEAAPYSVTAV